MVYSFTYLKPLASWHCIVFDEFEWFASTPLMYIKKQTSKSRLYIFISKKLKSDCHMLGRHTLKTHFNKCYERQRWEA